MVRRAHSPQAEKVIRGQLTASPKKDNGQSGCIACRAGFVLDIPMFKANAIYFPITLDAPDLMMGLKSSYEHDGPGQQTSNTQIIMMEHEMICLG